MEEPQTQEAKPFSLLAKVYDAIMSDIDYEDWGEFILETAKKYGWRNDGLVLDLGCGTGNSTFPIFARGLQVVGLDYSAEMLEIARAKLPPVEFVQADFREIKLDREFSLVYSVFDAINNLLTDEDVLAMAKSIYDLLEPNGIFIFDVNTTIGLRELWANGKAEGWAGEVYYSWNHFFDEETGLAKVEAFCEDNDISFTETHYERPYDSGLISQLLSEVGFKETEILKYPGGGPAKADAPRIWVVAKK
ncbi:MAG TPA: class I SAM-dependent methyltransferase [Trueperaceae bacterium]|nr:class I SAM-dependent methyltransferase [Trueperaceae bacterium]